MKIVNITFKNINNLKGENTISFDQEPLSSAGIFAITGPTGSGKSTLLDVITLALFNKIPRYSGKITRTGIEEMGSVITHHAIDAAASITYEIQGVRYTSAWSVNRTKAGKLKDYEMFIYESDGTPMDLKKSDVPGRNEEIIGLKYDQFIKSIILSQGQFAKFLKADKNERGQLLENLTGSSIYRKIGMAAYEKYKSIKKEVEQEMDRQQNIIVLDEDKRIEIKALIGTSDKEKTKLDKKLVKEKAIKQLKTEIQNYRAELVAKEKVRTNLINEVEDFKKQAEKLAIYDKLSPLRGELTRYQDAKKVMTNLQRDLALNKQLIEQSKESLGVTIFAMAELTGQKVNAENFKSEMSAFEKEVNSIDQELGFIKMKGAETRQRINAKLSRSKVSLDSKIGPAEALSILSKRQSELNGIISISGLTEGADHEKVKSEITTDRKYLQTLRDLHHAYEHIDDLDSKVKECQTNQKAYQSEIEQNEPLLKSTESLVQSTEQNIKLLQLQKQNELLIAKLTDLRPSLVDGDPCPLCGAVHHPYAEHSPESDNDIDQQLKQAKERLLEHQNNQRSIAAKLTTSTTGAKLNLERFEVYKKELLVAQAQSKTLLSEYAGDLKVEPASIVQSGQKLTTRIKSNTDALDALEELKVVVELVEDYHSFQAVLAEHVTLNNKRKQKYQGQNVSADCNRLQDQFVDSNTKITTLNTLLDAGMKTYATTELILISSFDVLSPQLQSLGFEDIETAKQYLISEEEVSTIKAQKELIAKRQTANQTEIETLNRALKEAIEKDDSPDQSLELISQGIITLEATRDQHLRSATEQRTILLKDDEAQLRLKSKATEVDNLNKKMQKWDLLNKMIGDAQGHKFANFAQGLTLQNLLVFANRRLENLSDRYLLDKPVKDGALTVIDQYQGNIQRSVATLSGGESFLISLALALSLSDMASKNVRLESLFIDEGFGTLDQETLDVAMNTLEKLQTESQKTVGVISHVEALKERINIQIRLDKNAQGYSSIDVVG